MQNNLRGVFVAAVTPLNNDGSLAIEDIDPLLSFYKKQGAHGALLFGTTGEGPSFSPDERIRVLREAVKVKQQFKDFKLIAGTGTPSLKVTAALNSAALDLGFDAVLSLPPYYFRAATDEGLFDWFSELIESSVPQSGNFMAYHFPQVSGVPLSINLLKKIKEHYPNRFVGVKDSSGDLESANLMVKELPGVSVFVGNDMLLRRNLEIGGAGSITAASNLISTLMRRIWDTFHSGDDSTEDQTKVDQIRKIVNGLVPFPPSMKALLHKLHSFPKWGIMPPMVESDSKQIDQAADQIKSILEI